MSRKKVKPTLESLLRERGSISSGELAEALEISRQAAHAQLRREANAGRLKRVGAGRTARYEVAVPIFAYAVAGAAEDRILDDVERATPELSRLDDMTLRAFRYAFAEMVNNALDHSAAMRVEVRVSVEPRSVIFDVADDGIGAFRRIREGRGLSSEIEAAAELTKGKITTLPERHTGEGIFFTSKVARRFELHANGHALITNPLEDDVAILADPTATRGTRVHVEIARPPDKSLIDVFSEYTEEHEFVRTRTIVRLFAIGRDFVSRSEARRLLHGLERFREVVLDFKGVPGVGQGFADEVFRVWASAHPGVTLVPIEMNDETRFFVERARAKS